MTSLVCRLLLCTALLLEVATATSATGIPLYIGGLFDMTLPASWGAIPAAQMALDEINNNANILINYTLKLRVDSTEGGLGLGQSVFHTYLSTPPQKVMLLGPVENTQARAIASYAALPENRILQFTYGTTDLEFAEDRNVYTYFFRTNPQAMEYIEPIIGMLKLYKWDEIGIIYEDSLLHYKVAQKLKSRVQANGIKVLTDVKLQASDPSRPIRTMLEKDVHVIIGYFYPGSSAKEMMCQAYRNKMNGPHYVWILMSSNSYWWKPSNNDAGGCILEEMACQMQNTFFLRTTGQTDDGTYYPNAGKNTSTILNDYYSRVDNGNNTINRTSNALDVYDAVWAIAHVLNNSRAQLESWGKPLENLTYGDQQVASLFLSETLKLNFLSPNHEKVRFCSNGNRRMDIYFREIVIQNGATTYVTAANIDTSTTNCDTLGNRYSEASSINWLTGIPYRRTTESFATRYIVRSLFIALVFLAALGIVYAFVCYLVVILNMKEDVIWNSSPVINIIIICGCILNYITIILYGFDYTLVSELTVTSICRARAWTFVIGFTLSVGGLIAKLWIAYCVLSDRFVKRRNMMLIWMLCIIAILFIIDIIIMGCWEGINPLRRELVKYRDQELFQCNKPISSKTFTAENLYVEHCKCDNEVFWILIVVIYKALLVVFGAFLAWQTRKLYIKSLNDTQHCVVCMFVVFVFCVAGVIVAFVAPAFPNVYYGIIGTSIFLCTTIILALLFSHKMSRVSCGPCNRLCKRGQFVKVGESDNEPAVCGYCSCCAAICACCACSPACCISFWSCFPCCNLYLCCRTCCCGSKVHPSAKDDDKVEFYIAGQPQELEGKIAYLLREIELKNEEIKRLRPTNALVSDWTQTYDDDLFYGDELDGLPEDDNNSDSGDSGIGKRNGRRRKSTRGSFKIFSQRMDWSHVQSKVESGVRKTPSPSPQKDEKYYINKWRSGGGHITNKEIERLKKDLEEKEKEIDRLKASNMSTARRGSKQSVGSMKMNQRKIQALREESSNVTEERGCQTDGPSGGTEVPLPNKKTTKVVTATLVTAESPKAPKRKASKTIKNGTVSDGKQKKDVEKTKPQDEWLFGKGDDQTSENFQMEKEDVPEVVVQQPTLILSKGKERDDRIEENKLKVEDENAEMEDDDRIRMEEEERKEEENKLEEERRKEEEKRAEEEEKRRKEEELEKKNKMEETKRQEEKKKEEERKRQEEEKRKEEENERKRQDEKRKEEEERKRQEDERRKQDDKEKEEKKKEEERKRQEEKEKEEKRQREENKKKEEEERKMEEEKKEEERRKAEEARRKEVKRKEEENEKERAALLPSPPNNTPEVQEDAKPSEEAQNDRSHDDDDDDEEDEDDDDELAEEGEDDEDEEDEDEDEDEKGGDGEGGEGDGQGRKKKKIRGNKLNWKGESKVDTGTGNATKRKRKKIKTYKVDYSNVRSRLTGAPAKNPEDEESKPKPKRVRRPSKRWRPDNSTNKPRTEDKPSGAKTRRPSYSDKFQARQQQKDKSGN